MSELNKIFEELDTLYESEATESGASLEDAKKLIQDTVNDIDSVVDHDLLNQLVDNEIIIPSPSASYRKGSFLGKKLDLETSLPIFAMVALDGEHAELTFLGFRVKPNNYSNLSYDVNLLKKDTDIKDIKNVVNAELEEITKSAERKLSANKCKKLIKDFILKFSPRLLDYVKEGKEIRIYGKLNGLSVKLWLKENSDGLGFASIESLKPKKDLEISAVDLTDFKPVLIDITLNEEITHSVYGTNYYDYAISYDRNGDPDILNERKLTPGVTTDMFRHVVTTEVSREDAERYAGFITESPMNAWISTSIRADNV